MITPEPAPTDTGTAEPTGALDPRTAAVQALGHELMRHARMLHLVKASLAARGTPHGLDGAEIALLMTLVKGGPRRQGELAEVALLDPSTVSRYVGTLARRGYVERRPDPADGRAVQLVATAHGEAVAAAMIARRNDALRALLTDWSEQDVRTLTALLTRFNEGIDAGRHLLDVPPPSSVAGPTGASL